MLCLTSAFFLALLHCCNAQIKTSQVTVPTDCESIETEAGMVLDLVNRHRQDGYVFGLLRVADAHKLQTENSSVLYLTLDVLETECSVLSGRPWETCEYGDLYSMDFGQCKIITYTSQMLKKPKLYGYNCTLSPVPPDLIECKDCPVKVEVLEVIEQHKDIAAKLLEKFNHEGNHTNYFKVDKVEKILKATASREVHILGFSIKETNCSRGEQQQTDEPLECEFLDDWHAHTGFCKARIVTDPDEPNGMEINCELYHPWQRYYGQRCRSPAPGWPHKHHHHHRHRHRHRGPPTFQFKPGDSEHNHDFNRDQQDSHEEPPPPCHGRHHHHHPPHHGQPPAPQEEPEHPSSTPPLYDKQHRPPLIQEKSDFPPSAPPQYDEQHNPPPPHHHGPHCPPPHGHHHPHHPHHHGPHCPPPHGHHHPHHPHHHGPHCPPPHGHHHPHHPHHHGPHCPPPHGCHHPPPPPQEEPEHTSSAPLYDKQHSPPLIQEKSGFPPSTPPPYDEQHSPPPCPHHGPRCPPPHGHYHPPPHHHGPHCPPPHGHHHLPPPPHHGPHCHPNGHHHPPPPPHHGPHCHPHGHHHPPPPPHHGPHCPPPPPPPGHHPYLYHHYHRHHCNKTHTSGKYFPFQVTGAVYRIPVQNMQDSLTPPRAEFPELSLLGPHSVGTDEGTPFTDSSLREMPEAPHFPDHPSQSKSCPGKPKLDLPKILPLLPHKSTAVTPE
ncbi:histidine-rich glycoprotein [Coturnix japonica]|uniref:Histidine-rich glycoprotein n=1 Tax=Coturnix japonica TaxID=93934 RepID=A0A8C2TUC9_COTJA|nr:histidine-rich glycoprotein [Coturnix japonica]